MVSSQAAADKRSISNTVFVRSVGIGMLSLIVSAAILISLFLLFYPQTTQSDTQKRTVFGDELTVVLGDAEKISTTLQLDKLSLDGRAILSRRTSLNTRDFPFIRSHIENHHPGINTYLIWRTAKNPDQVMSTPVRWTADNTNLIDMTKHEGWQGTIIELGLDIYGDLREQPLVIEKLTLLPFSRSTLLLTTLSQWTTFHGWDQTSINLLRGTSEDVILPPTVAIAAWAGLALLILFIFSLLAGTHNVITYGIAILIPWMTLDLLWQWDLNVQLDETRYLFSERTQYDKHLAERDSELYSYAQHLKNDVLPDPGAKIHVLHDSGGHNYTRLRMQFHLLPHNIYNYGRRPKTEHTRPGDYILVLKSISGLNFNNETSTLSWGKKKKLWVSLIDKSPMGTLYQLPLGVSEKPHD